MKPLISVITPTRNRAHTLIRVFNSLNSQKFKNFEWLVCDDASNDKTLSLLRKFKKKSKFKIRIFHYKVRAGKPIIDNFCISKSSGKFIVFADSDDAFKNNSFKDFTNEWKKIPKSKKLKTFAIISRCLGPNGKPLEKKINLKEKSISYNDLIYRYKKNTEKWLFINKNILTKYRFPEIDYYVPEGIIWSKISLKYNLWLLDNCYRIFYSDTKNSITHSKKINYPIGQLKAIEMFIKSKFLNQKNIYNLIINFHRFKLINNIFFNYRLKNRLKISLTLNIFLYTIGCLYFIKDYLFLNIDKEKFIKNNKKPIEIVN